MTKRIIYYKPTSIKLNCPYCGRIAHLIDSNELYGTSYGNIYICPNYPLCDSYVGCHKNTTIPKGTMANKRLRDMRIQAHKIIDVLWKSGTFKRDEVYVWLADKLQIKLKHCHIAMFNESECTKVIELLKEPPHDTLTDQVSRTMSSH